MPIEEFDKRYFTREQVKTRLLKRAAESWGFLETEMDDFDPLVSMLVEGCSLEFEKIAREIGKSQDRVLERLAGLLHPGTLTVKPAWGVIQVRPAGGTVILGQDAQFVYRHTDERARDKQTSELFFSPVNDIRIFDAAIRYIASAQELFRVEEGTQKFPLAYMNQKPVEYQHSIWLGLELSDEIDSLENVSFFFSWSGQDTARLDSLYKYLPYTQWYCEDVPLKHQSGQEVSQEIDFSKHADFTFDEMDGFESDVHDVLSPRFITLPAQEILKNAQNLKKRPYPLAFDAIFLKNDLRDLSEPLLWIEIRFPSIVPSEALFGTMISTNAVPVINRKLNRLGYKLAQSLNIVPLETDATFLYMREITNSEGQQVRLVPFSDAKSLSPETYTLRFGINRFNERNTHDTLLEMTDLIKEERSYFAALGADFLIQNIKELDQTIARIEEKLKRQATDQSPFPYLIIRPKREGANVSIAFWSCNGARANKVAPGSRLSPYRDSNVRSNSLVFLTSTFGGKDKFNDAEKIEQYKRSLVSHDRIVTLNDLKLFVQGEIGSSASDIVFQKKFVKGTGKGQGFIECMTINIKPVPGTMDAEDWSQKLQELALRLEKRSVHMIPYRLNLIS